MSVQRIYGPASHNNLQPLTEQDVNNILKANKENFNQFYDNKILPLVQQGQELLKKKEELIKNRDENIKIRDENIKIRDENIKIRDENIKIRDENIKIRDESLKKVEVLNARAKDLAEERKQIGQTLEALAIEKEEADKKIAGAQAMKAEAQAMKAKGDAILAEVAKQRLDALTQQFIGIFDKTPLSADEINAQYHKYLAGNNHLTVEKAEDGSYSKINSMGAVIHYLKDHPNTKFLDFRSFKAAVEDVSTLSNYLKTALTVTVVGFKECISNDSKKDLDQAVAVRDGTLKVRYFA
jgi:hypothetical protein